MQYTEKDIEKLIETVTVEFTSHLAKAEENFKLAKSEAAAPVETLVKAEDGEKKPEEKKPEAKEQAKEGSKEKGPEEKAPEAKEGEKAPAIEAKAPAEGEAKPEGEAPAAEAAPGAPAAGEDHCDYDDADREHMQKMYMSMSKGELKAHHDSCRAALDQKGMAKCGEQAPMIKSETAVASIEVAADVKSEPTKELELLKSEVATEKAKSEALQKNLDTVSAILTKLVEKKAAPQAKAITSLEVIAKSEGGSTEAKPLTKGEIDAVLLKKSQDPKLEKSDRDAINNFYLGGGSINSISHLLK